MHVRHKCVAVHAGLHGYLIPTACAMHTHAHGTCMHAYECTHAMHSGARRTRRTVTTYGYHSVGGVVWCFSCLAFLRLRSFCLSLLCSALCARPFRSCTRSLAVARAVLPGHSPPRGVEICFIMREVDEHDTSRFLRGLHRKTMGRRLGSRPSVSPLCACVSWDGASG